MRYEFQASALGELHPTVVEAVNLRQARSYAIMAIKKTISRRGDPVPTDSEIDLGSHTRFTP